MTTLVCRAQAGDRTAYDRLVWRFQDRAVGYGYSFLGDFHAAQDAAQEAFLLVFHDLPTLREPAAFPGWLRKIVFKCCDRMTRRKRPSVAPLDAAREIAGPRHADPAEALEAAERGRRRCMRRSRRCRKRTGR